MVASIKKQFGYAEGKVQMAAKVNVLAELMARDVNPRPDYADIKDIER